MIDENPGRFPLGGTRAVIYAATARKGRLSGAVHHALTALREVADYLVVVTGELAPDEISLLRGVADEIVSQTDGGEGLHAHGPFVRSHAERLGAFDEVVLTNDQWFGPVAPIKPVVERMEDRYLDVWSLTDRREGVSGARTEGGDGRVQLSGYWLAVRQRVWKSDAWHRLWRGISATTSERRHAHGAEVALSEQLTAAGFRLAAAFPSENYPAEHPDMFNVDLLLADGCPAVKREIFNGYPLFYDQHAIVGRRIAAAMAGQGYPVDLLWSDLAATVAPKRLHTNGAMLEVLPDRELATGHVPLRILGIVHVVDLDPLPDLIARTVLVPGIERIVFTMADASHRGAIEAAWEATGHVEGIAVEIREALGRDTPDTAVVFDECRDLTFSGEVDLVLAVHTGAAPSMTSNARSYFEKQQYDCLLHSPGYTANVIQLFRDHTSLGIVFPPTPHIGMSTLGEGWLGQADAVSKTMKRLEIDVPLDWASPHAPVGGMWLGRPEALRLLGGQEWPVGEKTSLVHSRLHAYAAGELGYHARTVATAEHAGLSHGSLEYTTDFMSRTSYGYPAGYTALLHRAGPVGAGRGVDFARMWVRYRRPHWWGVLSRLGRVARATRAVGRSVRRRLRKRA